ncbi:CamS family sex pheromone protein [Pullulanibacillus camelliae]|uniref:CamS family sex pheromone protein n=1 Tax=Pullulanibacillus camelliae TaxID=1707096 RepID=UPI001E3E2F25|nr:CamS family sex pheromone protein [Pullulanibacillus camelliae]
MVLGLCLLFVLIGTTACTMPWSKDDKQHTLKNTKKGNDEKITIVPQDNEKDYQIWHSDKTSPSRGYITYGVNNRLDINEMEMGLMRLSKSVFDPGKYYFQSGRYISTDLIDEMLARKLVKGESSDLPGVDKQGLNPPYGKGSDIGKRATDEPKELSYVLEQDYLTKNGKLSGVSLAVSMNSVYNQSIYYKKTGKTYPVDVTLNKTEQMQKGKSYANKVLQRIRQVKGLENVPVFVALYLEAAPGYDAPGHFYAVGTADGSARSISKWKNTGEDNVLFPSNEAESKYKDYYDKFDKFKDKIKSYFPNYTDVIGQGFIKGNKLQNLTMNININFFDETEIVSFTNYISGLLQSNNPFEVPIQINISDTTGQPEAVVVNRSDMDKPFVYVYGATH